jgi:DnaJ-class molecular chaperone
MYMLDTGGGGLPTAAMEWWERLGLAGTESRRDIRHAYHQHSLLWHPDRWVGYPLYHRLAQSAFELITEAYHLASHRKRPGVDVGSD